LELPSLFGERILDGPSIKRKRVLDVVNVDTVTRERATLGIVLCRIYVCTTHDTVGRTDIRTTKVEITDQMATRLREINLVDPRLCIFLCLKDGGVDAVTCLIQIGNDSLFNAFGGTNTVPDDVEPRVANNFPQEDDNLGRPDLYGGDDSGLAHTGSEINTYVLSKVDARG
jgi:hypothetical protein